MVKGGVYLKEEITKIWMAHFYNYKVKEGSLKEGDLILRKIEAIRKGAIQGKPTLIGKVHT